MEVYRRIATGGTSRFMGIPLVQTTISSLPNRNLQTQDMQIQTRDGTSIGIRVYRPQPEHAAPLPVLVMAPSGGWCLGGLDTDELRVS